MPLSLIISLVPRWDSQVPRTSGHLTHGAFFKILAARNGPLAERLHALDSPTLPFSVSELIGTGGQHEGRRQVGEGRHYCIRITSLDTELSRELLAMERSPPPEVSLSRLPFRVLGATTEPRSHSWAGRASWDELVGTGVRRAAGRRLHLEFASPTSFRDGHHNTPLPVPHLVFGSLADKWQAFAPEPLRGLTDTLAPSHEDWHERARTLDRQLHVARYRLQTRLLEYPEYRRVGFVGQVEFELGQGLDRGAQAAAHTLAAFAQFAGIGDKTPMGMGQVRLHPQSTDGDEAWI